ncbi:ribosome biogenesis GTPase YlqF [Desulfofundulus thermocisternus]|uniref:ribosome biogenesis GTPase YlqF n=1 Tax=Desulfofundulus thermocisternus TaxID=42471 RepID=UPI0019DF11CD|nr:ribosome biogenesis GTPase YlqF [Desulfofundulus thermocisternus]MBE3586502.1 ribosome biogenesis GTPase YlqF [Thermoanaerobacter sp.]MCS5697230.1 ribosome biogenesis GTPase YlqF [Desulfofundulus thermocisternus]
MPVQWFPGHMARARRLVQENLKLVDVVIELLDARIPASSRNPIIEEIAVRKPHLVVLNKEDLADPHLTRMWLQWFSARGLPALAVDSARKKDLVEVPVQVKRLAENKIASLVARGRRPPPPRCMVVGIPNVGKSSFINALAGSRVTRTGNRPGVTRGPQWIRLAGEVELLDTPGVLWPKFEDPRVGLKLAATGAIKEEVFDVEEVAAWLVEWLRQSSPASLKKRYGLEELPSRGYEVLELIGARRGLVGRGGRVDLYRASIHLLKEFRDGCLGRFTLDAPPG